MLRIFTVFALLLAVGCNGKTGPPSVTETSAARPVLADRIRFVETYVKFKRKYDDLEYDIFYQNNGGGLVPGPSDWDVRIVAIVPPDEIDNWKIVGKLDASIATPKWVAATARSIDTGLITEWYTDGNRTVGIGRSHNVVAYRAFTR